MAADGSEQERCNEQERDPAARCGHNLMLPEGTREPHDHIRSPLETTVPGPEVLQDESVVLVDLSTSSGGKHQTVDVD